MLLDGGTEIERRRRQVLASLGGGFSLASVFEGGTYPGFYYDFTTEVGLYQTTDTSSPVTASGQAVGRATDGSPSGTNATQGTSAARGTWNSGGYWLGDGSDDHLTTGLVPAADMSLVACFQGAVADRHLISSLGTGRCYLALNASGRVVGSFGSVFAFVVGSADVRNLDTVALFRYSASVGELFVNGVSQATGTPSGSVSTTALTVGANNNGGTPGQFWSGRIHRVLAVKRYVPDSMVLPLMRYIARPNGNFAGVSF